MEGVLRLIWEAKIDKGLPNVLLFAVTMRYTVRQTWRSFWMSNERPHVLRTKRSLPTHHSGVVHAAQSPRACLRCYMVRLGHISSYLLTTIPSMFDFDIPQSSIRQNPSGAWSISFFPKPE
jgi:hypothetical protein